MLKSGRSDCVSCRCLLPIAISNITTTYSINMSKSPITCHVLDSTLGKPAANVRVQLEELSPSGTFSVLATGSTNADGRCPDLLAGHEPAQVLRTRSVFKMVFYTGEYFGKQSRPTFYPQVEVRVGMLNMGGRSTDSSQILFQLAEQPDAHYHIPLLMSPFSYTTYRGS